MKSILGTIAVFAVLFSASFVSAEKARPTVSAIPVKLIIPDFIAEETIHEATVFDGSLSDYDSLAECNDAIKNVDKGMDTDADGIPDKVETSIRKMWVAEGFLLKQAWVYDPANADCDCQGKLSCWYKVDTDRDGIQDAIELWNSDFWTTIATLSGDEPIEERIVHPQDSGDTDGVPDVLDMDSDDDGLPDGREDSSVDFQKDSKSYMAMIGSLGFTRYLNMADKPVECDLSEYGSLSKDTGIYYGYFVIKRFGEVFYEGSMACLNETLFYDSNFNGIFDMYDDSSDARTPDTDGDGFCDGDGPGCEGLEINDRCPTKPGDIEGCPNYDSDGDGLSDEAESMLGTDPMNPDTDSDGLWDGVEDANHDGILQPLEGESDPLNPDTDGDGLNDGREHQLGTDPSIYDTDGDGIADGVEDQNRDGQYQIGTETDARSYDTDGDGLSDGFEDANHDGIYQPLNGESDPLDPDSDKDGISDGHEASGCVVDPGC